MEQLVYSHEAVLKDKEQQALHLKEKKQQLHLEVSSLAHIKSKMALIFHFRPRALAASNGTFLNCVNIQLASIDKL